MNAQLTEPPLIRVLGETDIQNLPPVRPIRNVFVQTGVRAKIAAFLSPQTPVYKPNTTVIPLADEEEVREHTVTQQVIRVITSISQVSQLMTLLNKYDIVIVHTSSLNDGDIIPQLQKNGYQISFIAQAWNETGSYVIENTPRAYSGRR